MLLAELTRTKAVYNALPERFFLLAEFIGVGEVDDIDGTRCDIDLSMDATTVLCVENLVPMPSILRMALLLVNHALSCFTFYSCKVLVGFDFIGVVDS